jgi:hypothetical protein
MVHQFVALVHHGYQPELWCTAMSTAMVVHLLDSVPMLTFEEIVYLLNNGLSRSLAIVSNHRGMDLFNWSIT